MAFQKELSNHKEELFCTNYVFIPGCTPAEAARTAGITINVDLYAERLLKRPEIKQRIEELQEIKQDAELVKSTPILVQLARIAFFDPSEIVEFSKDPDNFKLSRFAKAAISGIEVNRTYSNSELDHLLIDVRSKVSLSNKIQALKLLGENIGAFSQINMAIAALKTFGIHLAKVNGRWAVVEDENAEQPFLNNADS